MTLEEYIPKRKKWHIMLKVIPILLLVFILKLIFHYFNWEVISLNALFTSLIAATTFLIGFLITGVISDYKESEKIPGELSASLETIYDEAYIINKSKKSKISKEFIVFCTDFTQSIRNWFYKKERTTNLMNKLSKMNDYFLLFESLTQANFISRMKQEQNNIRKMIIRIHTIRETSFVQSAYAIVESLAFFLILGLLLLKLEPFYESVFFSILVSFLVSYMVLLIKDLDNPFDYSNYGETGTEVSLKPIQDFIKRIEENSSKNN